MTHICIVNLTIIDSGNGLSPGWCHAIIWSNGGILSIGPLGTNFNEILIKIQTFSFKKMHLKMSSAKWRSFCLGLNVLNQQQHEACCCLAIFNSYIPLFMHVHCFEWLFIKLCVQQICIISLIARFMGPTWGPSGADRTQVGPLLAQWTLLSGIFRISFIAIYSKCNLFYCVYKKIIRVSDRIIIAVQRQIINSSWPSVTCMCNEKHFSFL